jgi:hypothetical protein
MKGNIALWKGESGSFFIRDINATIVGKTCFRGFYEPSGASWREGTGISILPVVEEICYLSPPFSPRGAPPD